MVNGINFITDEKGKQIGIILDLQTFKRNNVQASEVLNSLSGLQDLIDQAGPDGKKDNNWDAAKKKLNSMKS
ncbi:MAG: hypothetical protein ACO1NS_07965 [Daejeonella sp.]|uniref:hypothetical protein n=1 Tax=Daejeonella sp. JGW-45 TaxID=3034148 RepID=UPI0023EB9785|nr:hypothetical protein [Daejeonella sp. JGW-45]